MTRSRLVWIPLLAGLFAVAATGCGEDSNVIDPVSADVSDSTPQTAEAAADRADLMGGGGIPLADSEVFFEFNSTDNDLGFQVVLDGEDWQRMKLFGPDEQKILDIHAKGELKDLGLTELRFESAEPSPGEVLDLFAPGEYVFVGRTTDGERLVGEGELSHDLLAPPVFSPSEGEEVDPENVVIEWEPVPGAELYEVIVSNEDGDGTMEIELSGEATEVDVPRQMLEPGIEYKVEVLAIAENGNKTISEGFFVTK